MVAIGAGRYRIGSDAHYPEERPARDVEIGRIAIDRTPVTNAEFFEFVRATGYVTVAERVEPAGSAVFRMTDGPVDLHDPSKWWTFCGGTTWNAPRGPGSSSSELGDHPVVHVGFEDAEAFAEWRGKRLPTEEEWEAAARGSGGESVYAWGDEFAPYGRLMANVWTGSFPWYFSRGAPGTTPVASFPPNANGAYDMIGNVWEWTRSTLRQRKPCGCAPPPAAITGESIVVLKGGSWLCAAEYCARYRPAARIGLTPDSTTGHIGFRCAVDL